MRALEDLNTVGRTCTRQLYEPMFIVSKGDCSKLKDAKFPDVGYAKVRAFEECGRPVLILSALGMEAEGLMHKHMIKTRIYVKQCDSL